jgi:hypothetical protein
MVVGQHTLVYQLLSLIHRPIQTSMDSPEAKYQPQPHDSSNLLFLQLQHWAVMKHSPGMPPGANTINPAVIEGTK